MMMDRRIVVTGATGLIGRRVVARLQAAGNHVIAVGRTERPGSLSQEIDYARIDLSNLSQDSLSVLGRFDGVIHLAQAVGWHDFPRLAGNIASVGLAATAHLAEYAVKAGASRFVLASSGGIYGPSAHPIHETDPIRPAAELGFYLAAKAAAEQLLGYFSPHMTIHILRPFFVYGPGQATSFMLPRLLNAVRSGTAVRVDGGTGSIINPIWVEDAAAAFIAVLDCDAPVTANIAGLDVVTVREIVTLAATRLGVTASFDETTRAPDKYVADTSIMVHKLGAATTSFETGLSALIDSLPPET